MGTKFANSRGWGEDVTGRGGGGGVDRRGRERAEHKKRPMFNVYTLNSMA